VAAGRARGSSMSTISTDPHLGFAILSQYNVVLFIVPLNIQCFVLNVDHCVNRLYEPH